ncbi:substrate-binding periplasmic protein [Undibacterium baiyunense]|uniref:Transporter substrate-binding domain-containing protein n=1 Tax=Undibacterium baiyunense TaxID=2828731 RepID=A0A941DE59_9BURK|nr:transporter substrate-binding domain-containing protein [Undibacterium baiyunense]MBR7747133.1 transporter substrate-binding domain-containing protein [Undibacterium baiyunense]
MRLSPTKFWKSCCLGALYLLAHSVAASTIDIKAYTEEWPPYNFLNGKQVTGISTDILRAACNNAHLQCEFQLVPWTRAYKTVQETKNTIIYTIARIPTREAQFVWIGPLFPRTTWIYARAEVADKIHHMKDLEKFRVGVIRAEASLTDLTEAGVPSSAIRIFNSNTDEMRMLKAGQIDVVVNTEIGMAVNQQQFDIGADKLVKLMKLYDAGSLYFGMNINSDPILIEKLQNAVDKLRRDGKIQLIVQQYTKAH